MTLRLRPFQREDAERLKQAGLRAIIASAPGTGKTPLVVVTLMETLGQSLPALVVCPASVTRHWLREFRRWAPGVQVHLVETIKERPRDDAHVYITSWALLGPKLGQYRRLGVKTLIADECHLARNSDTIRSRALLKIAKRTPHLLMLTGTPIVNNHQELEVIEALFGRKKPLMIRRLLEDVAPDIPQKKRSYLYINLRERAQKEYERATNDFEEWLRKEKERLFGEGMAEEAVERALSAEGFAKIGYLRRLLGESKVPAAADWISRAVRVGEPVVVFLEHQGVLKKLSKALRRQRVRHVVLEGKTNPKKRQEYIDKFQRHYYPVIICTKAGIEGITLHSARNALFVERFFTSTEEEQAEDRIRRIGQHHKTRMWYLHVPGTIDDRMDVIVQSKRVLIRSAIRSVDTVESEQSAVISLVASWENFITQERATCKLGLGSPLPKLPSPTDTHSIIFKGKRWNPRSVRSWCRMHGYAPIGEEHFGGQSKLIIHPVHEFMPEKYGVFRVCSDIKLVIGERIKKYRRGKRK
jgi:SNF2 family DNA or RNA helicase